MTGSLNGIKILLGVTGGIAAYKSADLCRRFIKQGADVRVIMSDAACRFITPLTMETLSGKPVPVKMFGQTEGPLEHIEVPDQADVFVIAPATADYLARCASGRASDLISSVTLAFDKSVVAAPAMNTNMWNNPATQRNINTLSHEHGWHIVPPESGTLACGWTGQGRMAELDAIIAATESLFIQDLKGKRIVISAGPTVEDIDPVRYLSNRSSGTMGYSIAQVAAQRGAEVVLVSGPTQLTPPRQATTIHVRSARQMEAEIQKHADMADGVIMCAAVADYRPKETAVHKLKKEDNESERILELIKNPDILANLGKTYASKERPILVGFALETENLIPAAQKKLAAKNIHMIVANLAETALEGTETAAIILDKRGNVIDTGPVTKSELATKILDSLITHWK